MSMFPTAKAAEQLHLPDLEAITSDELGVHRIPCTRCDLVVEITGQQAAEGFAETVGDIDRIGWIVDQVHDAHIKAGR